MILGVITKYLHELDDEAISDHIEELADSITDAAILLQSLKRDVVRSHKGKKDLASYTQAIEEFISKTNRRKKESALNQIFKSFFLYRP